MPSSYTRTPEIREKSRLAHLGQIVTEEHRQKISQASKKMWQDPAFKEGRIRASLKGMRKRPTFLEQQLITLIETYHLPFEYTGAGRLIIDSKIPDFANMNGKKQLIECFGIYWHDIFDVARRTEHYAKQGYSLLIIWEDEMDNEKKVLAKIRKFIGGRKCRPVSRT